jgi:uncharacterized membrane protein
MGLVILIVGLVVFFASHLFVTARDKRATLIERLGTNGYRAAFSVVSLVGLALIIWGYAGYRAQGMIPVWSPPAFMRHVTVGLMLISIVALASFRIPSHIQTWLKHPMLASIKIWAFAHLLANGDLGSILLFGSFLAWAVYARIAAKRRGDLGPKTAPAGWTNDILVVVIGVAVYLLLGFYFHPYVIGVNVFGRA